MVDGLTKLEEKADAIREVAEDIEVLDKAEPSSGCSIFWENSIQYLKLDKAHVIIILFLYFYISKLKPLQKD